jgi:outer membrane lipoprotein-sorting protein
MALKGWTVLDAQGQKTEVRLTGFAAKANLPANLFVLRDPRPRAARL